MKVLIAGDYVPSQRTKQLIENEQYELVFGDFKHIVLEDDYSIVNLECPVVFGNAKPIEKEGPNLRCTQRGGEALKYAGFKCVTLANNHFLDFGAEGVKDTITTLNKLQIDYVGGGNNLDEAAQILYKTIKGERLAIINCCEHEFSIATENTAGCNPLNPIKQHNAIKEARKNADYVLVIVHGGHEHFQLPSPRMVETYHFFIDSGADAVVNHHQHCYNGYEVYGGKPIFYGLGNFCFDHNTPDNKLWVEGYAVTLNLSNTKVEYEIHPYLQCAEQPCVKPINQNSFEDKLREINEIISNSKELKKRVEEYYSKFVRTNNWIFEPLRIRILHELNGFGLFPSLISRTRKLEAANIILCESLRDRLFWWLEH